MSTITRQSAQARNSNVMAGIDKHITSNITLGGVSRAPADIKAVFSNHSAAITAAEALHQQWRDQVQAAGQAGETARSTYAQLRSYLLGQYGSGANAILNDFGMTAPKSPGAKTVGAKTAGIAKRAATRAARHTMGKNQKKSVKGDVTGVVIEPVTPSSGSPAPGSPPAVTASPPAASASGAATGPAKPPVSAASGS